MKVILQQDVIGLGDAGAIVEVKRGFAQNFLLPRGMALPASAGNMRRLEHLKRGIAVKQAKAKIGADAIKEKMEAFSCTIKARAGEEDKLFGSVTTQDIAKELNAHGFDIDRRQIHLADPIKMLGVYTVPVRIHREVSAQLKVWVVADEESKAAAEAAKAAAAAKAEEPDEDSGEDVEAEE